jgi:hypothetical protein
MILEMRLELRLESSLELRRIRLARSVFCPQPAPDGTGRGIESKQ